MVSSFAFLSAISPIRFTNPVYYVSVLKSVNPVTVEYMIALKAFVTCKLTKPILIISICRKYWKGQTSNYLIISGNLWFTTIVSWWKFHLWVSSGWSGCRYHFPSVQNFCGDTMHWGLPQVLPTIISKQPLLLLPPPQRVSSPSPQHLLQPPFQRPLLQHSQGPLVPLLLAACHPPSNNNSLTHMISSRLFQSD